LKNTPKPEKMSVKQWINRIKNINSYLPLMQPNGRPFTKEDLIAEVISKNIPNAWIKDFKMFKLHLKTSIKEIISELTVIEEQIKPHPKTSQANSNGKHLKNPCRIHNGGHEWDDCRQNPKNQKEDGRTKHENNWRGNGNGNSNSRLPEEQRRTEGDGKTTREQSRSNHSHSSDDEQEIYVIRDGKEKGEKTEEKLVPSSEVLVAIPEKKGSKKYKTYLGLVDSGSSGSLINKELVENADYEIKLNSRPTKWDTATGVLQTNGTVQIESFILPQFARKRYLIMVLYRVRGIG